jgi:hypothetical protein
MAPTFALEMQAIVPCACGDGIAAVAMDANQAMVGNLARRDADRAKWSVTCRRTLMRPPLVKSQTPPKSIPPSAALRAVVDMGIVTVRAGTPALMELGFDGETRGQSMDFRPGLSLVLHW